MTPSQFILEYAEWILVGLLSLIQIAPIKINPWSKLLEYIGNTINKDLKQDVAELKRDFEETKAENMRWYILDFANSCRHGQAHTREEWTHVIDQLKNYEIYVEKKKISNGVIEEETKYLRHLYRERCEKNDFL